MGKAFDQGTKRHEPARDRRPESDHQEQSEPRTNDVDEAVGESVWMRQGPDRRPRQARPGHPAQEQESESGRPVGKVGEQATHCGASLWPPTSAGNARKVESRDSFERIRTR